MRHIWLTVLLCACAPLWAEIRYVYLTEIIHGFVAPLAVFGALCGALAARRRAGAWVGTRALGLVLLGAAFAWGARFWLVDLGGTRFSVVLFLFPVGIVLGSMLWRTAEGALLGALISLSWITTAMALRIEASGCTGVSSVFYETLFVWGAVGFIGAPVVAGIRAG